jgi:hypothetical protein
MLIPVLFSLAMPCILCAVLTASLPLVSLPFAFLAKIPLQLGLHFVQQAPILRYSMVDGALLPLIIGRMLIISIVIVGMGIHADESEKCYWKACL